MTKAIDLIRSTGGFGSLQFRMFAVIAFFSLATAFGALAQADQSTPRIVDPEVLEKAPDVLRDQLLPRHPAPYPVAKTAGSYSAYDWKMAIDSTWGPGLPNRSLSGLFVYFRNIIHQEFACFHGLDIDWDSICASYSQEIIDSTISCGRFSAMLCHAARTLQESHTIAHDTYVYFTQPAPGIPIMFVGGWGVNDHFGAALTPLPDSSLLVYRAVENHPLGLVPGDIVLGYDGFPWKQLYPELIEAELPVGGYWWGSSGPSYTHAWLMAAGMNWHLFDTIDIIDYSTRDTLHLPTSLLADRSMTLFATEQMDIPGVPMPDFESGQSVSWGIIEGTRIGYIYCIGWYMSGVSTEWYRAVDSLMNHYQTSGLIIDLRTNYGGYPPNAFNGYELLFKDDVYECGTAWRDPDSDDRLAMIPSPLNADSFLNFSVDPDTYYDKPIAVLIGPGCMSAGDLSALALSYHPMSRLFGKPTAAAFNSPQPVELSEGIRFRFSRIETYLLNEPDHYLTHDVFPNPVDHPWIRFEEVWHTPEQVARGEDNVVEAAINWINSTTDVADREKPPLAHSPALGQNFPNPFNTSTNIRFSLPSRMAMKMEIFDILGRRAAVLADRTLSAGSYTIRWDAHAFPGGVYFCRLRAGRYSLSRPMVLMK